MLEFIKCPKCHDDVQENAYDIHVNKTCIALGKSPEEVQAIQEANDLPFSVVDTLSEQKADLPGAPEEPDDDPGVTDGDY